MALNGLEFQSPSKRSTTIIHFSNIESANSFKNKLKGSEVKETQWEEGIFLIIKGTEPIDLNELKNNENVLKIIYRKE